MVVQELLGHKHSKTTEIYIHVSTKLNKIGSLLARGVISIQNEYIRNADTTPIWDDIRNAYMNKLYDIPQHAENWIYFKSLRDNNEKNR